MAGQGPVVVVAVRQDEHRRLKAIAATKGLKVGALASDILEAWLRGEVYSCPGGRVDSTPRREEDASE